MQLPPTAAEAMPDLNIPRLYVITDPYDQAFQPRLVEATRIEYVYPLAPLGGIVRRARDRELYALAQTGVPIEELRK